MYYPLLKFRKIFYPQRLANPGDLIEKTPPPAEQNYIPGTRDRYVPGCKTFAT